MALLIAGKLVNITVPLFYKQAVDALSGAGTAGAVIAVPVGLILAYGLARVTSQGFNELRNGVFAKVAQRAVRRIALSAFRHIHSLSLRFHLDRRTGGLARAVERGIAGIEFLLSFMLFNVIPTLFEILVVSAILWRLYNWQFAAVTLATIVTYIAFTFVITDWRVRFRREMNERNSEANTKSVDSLLNYETVKYFANEEHEAQRYDRALQAYERAAVKSETTLALLNVGQGAIIASGLIGIMLLAGQGVAAGRMTIGDFVLVNAYLIWDLEAKRAVAFDTGADCSSMLKLATSESLAIKMILLTHAHPDHVADLPRLREETGAQIFAPARELVLGAEKVEEGKRFDVGKIKIEARLTWGHSPGGTTFVCTGLARPVAIVGDSMFAGSMGGGSVSYSDAVQNNLEKILTLPDETIICPGHGPMTSVGEEKLHNPFFAHRGR